MDDSLTLDEHEAVSALLILKQQQEEDDVEDEEEEEEDVEEEESESEDELEVKICSQTNENKGKKRKVVTEDNSEETLRCMRNWKDNRPEYPPGRIFFRDPDAVGDCSKPMRKQLMESDVIDNQCRLLLGKGPVQKMMDDVLGKTEKHGINGVNVSVYGPDGKIHKMVFKMWGKDTPVLMSSGWKNFVKRYALETHRDFLTIWMFRHKETRQICFAIDSNRFPVKGKLNRRIAKAAF